MKEKSQTRRDLSVVSSIYDQPGFLAPVLLLAKFILQRLSKEKISWDEEIPQHLLRDWSICVNQLSQVSNFQIARCIKLSDFGPIATAQYNYFPEASESSYARVSYLKLTNEDGHVHHTFVMGNPRVAPLKQITIPHLTAAVLAVKINKMIKNGALV